MREHPRASDDAEATVGAPVTQRRGPRVVHVTTAHHVGDPRIDKETQSLADAGYDTYLVAPHPRDALRRGVALRALPPVRSRWERVCLQHRAYRMARDLQAGLYHVHDPELLVTAYALRVRTGARVVYDMHENYRCKGGVAGQLVRAVERWAFRWVDHVVVANPAHVAISGVHGVSTGVVANYYRPPGRQAAVVRNPREAFTLVYTGVISEQRGLTHLVDLAALVAERYPRWRVELAGVCYLEGQRHRAAARLEATGARRVVHRLGWDRYVPWPRLVERCRAAHVGLALMEPVRNHDEVLPTKFFEYLHAGLPILCSDFPLWRAFVEQHRCGAVVPPGDVRAALRVLEAWQADPAVYDRLAAGARSAARHYRWASEEERLLQQYAALVGPPPGCEVSG